MTEMKTAGNNDKPQTYRKANAKRLISEVLKKVL